MARRLPRPSQTCHHHHQLLCLDCAVACRRQPTQRLRWLLVLMAMLAMLAMVLVLLLDR